MDMVCMQCERVMPQLHSGAYARCCDGIGYYWPESPLPKDRPFVFVRTKFGWLYRNWFKAIPAPPKDGE